MTDSYSWKIIDYTRRGPNVRKDRMLLENDNQDLGGRRPRTFARLSEHGN